MKTQVPSDQAGSTIAFRGGQRALVGAALKVEALGPAQKRRDIRVAHVSITFLSGVSERPLQRSA